MAGGTRHAVSSHGGSLELLPLALARPSLALSRARELLANGRLAPFDASVARQVVGIVLRDFGDVDAAIAELRAAVRLARASGSPEREADVLATLGIALVYAGRTRAGLARLDAAARLVSGAAAARVIMRRAATLRVLGWHSEALADLRRAAAAFRKSGDTIWEARALSHLALTHLALGATQRADADFATAQRLFAATSQDLESVYATHNRGLAAFRRGDLPAALSHLDAAERRYAALAVPMPDLNMDRCSVLLAAGLPRDALLEADRGIVKLEQIGGPAMKKAELLLTAARAALAAADPATALERAQAARRLFAAQRRPWWHAHAEFVLQRARFAAGMTSGKLLRDAGAVAARLEGLGSDDAPRARLLAGRVALALGRAQEADRQLATAALAHRRRSPALSRVNGWLAEALRAEAAGDRRRLMSACRHGLGLLDEHRLTLGATELRAQVTARGAELAELAQRCALAAGRPRLLLSWSERWRATALAVPPVRPVNDQELRAGLAAVREVTSRLDSARAQGMPVAALQREQLRLEAAIRSGAMRARGTGHVPGTAKRGRIPEPPFDVGELLAELGSLQLIQIVSVSGDLHALLCGAGKVRRFAAGRTEDAAREVDFARFGLNRLALDRRPRRGPAGGDAPGGIRRQADALADLAEAGRRIENILLGHAGRYLGDGPVVIVPPGRLHAVPWALLPSLRDRVVSVAPSARAWIRARRTVPPSARRADPPSPAREVVLVRGPGLGTWGGEVPALAAEYGNATVLESGSATAARVLEAVDGAPLVHVAAHGTFRADSPLFSSLRMDDGPLTVHDFERLRCAPYRLVLPACDSGLLAPAGADELLGLASSLMPLGTVGIVASVVRVNDKAVAELMLALHRRLRSGTTLAESLRDARASAGDDPVQVATGWSFIALGAG
jgi:tetratricopeptide (TPR) repeat protein